MEQDMDTNIEMKRSSAVTDDALDGVVGGGFLGNLFAATVGHLAAHPVATVAVGTNFFPTLSFFSQTFKFW